MVLKVGSRGHIPAFMVMEVMRAAAEREQRNEAVFHLEVGQPGTPAPRGVIAAAHKALDSDRLGYTTALGLPDLRAAIAGHYKDSYGVTVPASQVVVTTGSSCGFILSFLSAFNPGDRVALAEPGYPCYRHILNALGITPVMLPVGPAERFQPTPALIEKAMAEGPLDGLIVASPSNPTGTMLDRDGMEALLACCRDNGIRVVSDEIYQGISFGMEPVTAAELEPTAIVVNSFSKYFCMTGWRLGWLIVPPDLLRAVECLAQNLFISPPTLSQIAAVAAFDCEEELQANIERYSANRQLLLEELPKAGFDDLAPSDGAFYIYADVGRHTNDSVEFCARILNETGVAITPGLDFDAVRGSRTVRFSFAGTTEEVRAAAEALKAWSKSKA